MTPTTVPIAAFSLTALAAASVSTGVETSNSSTSPMAIVKVCADRRAVRRGRRDLDVDARADRLAVDRRRRRHHAGAGVDREQPAGVAGQRVGHAVVVASASEAEAVTPTTRADRRVLGDRVGRRVGVDRRRHVELVDVADGDREGLRRRRAVGRGRRDLDVDARADRLAVDRAPPSSPHRCWRRSANRPPGLLVSE